ncbi:ets DNA-binding protein pokkuri isoform X1 [Phlebotomus papatasi]|uniref:ets DNA-binding protein pokkuri isoform X1 n=1 Tax=Phlebotomus papatasi TaxID=29031 RepID=UPI00248449C3|nr:ets DNA-binding protein pokkuri isoform X1 [Phlebotomus papatasi]
MKLLPIPPLPALGAPPPLGIWGQASEMLWRFPHVPNPLNPLNELKTQLPAQLTTDPRLWTREDVGVFLRWCEREFDLPKFEMDLFQMNGKALCLLTKTDLAERIPGAGDILHNVLHMLVRDSQLLHRYLPNSPVTPTSRYPLSPHSQPPTPNWTQLAPPDSPLLHSVHLQHLMTSNSVTLSPAPSVDSQGSPPRQQDGAQAEYTNGSSSSNSNGVVTNGAGSSGSAQSESDEDTFTYGGVKREATTSNGNTTSPPVTPLRKEPPNLPQQINAVMNSWSNQLTEKSASAPNTPGAFLPVKTEFFPVKNEFFPSDSPEPNTNGRLLWDFLQQLLNDPAQRYSSYIAWKCRDTGVFKIVDPAGLAKLWGIQKNHLSMNYDKMSRALRYYYRVNILRKVQGERHCYQFLRNPSELKNIKNISLLRQTPTTSTGTSTATTNGSATTMGGTSTSTYSSASFPSSPSAFQTSFHHLSVSNGSNYPVKREYVDVRSFPPVSTVKSESMDVGTEDMPTDLSIGADRKYTISRVEPECFPLIKNSNGVTTIQLVQRQEHNSTSPLPGSSTSDRGSPSGVENVAQSRESASPTEDSTMPTDLRKTSESTAGPFSAQSLMKSDNN